MNIQNVKGALNIFMREQLRVLKLEANVNGMKKVKSAVQKSAVQKRRSKWKRNL